MAKGDKVRSVSKTTKDEKTTEISVREIENGYILREYTSWEDKKGYHSESKETYYEEDPMKKFNIDW